jgi:hypothetical protein
VERQRGRLGVAQHIERDALLDVRLRAHATNRLLHLAMPAIATLDGIGRSRQQAVIQKGQGLLRVGGEQRLQRLANFLKALHTCAQVGEFGQGRLRPAAPIKQPVDFVHPTPLRFGDYSEVAQGAQVRQPAGDEV